MIADRRGRRSLPLCHCEPVTDVTGVAIPSDEWTIDNYGVGCADDSECRGGDPPPAYLPLRGHEPARRQWRSQGQAQCVQRSAGDDGALSPRISAASPQTEVVERSETGGVNGFVTAHPSVACRCQLCRACTLFIRFTDIFPGSRQKWPGGKPPQRWRDCVQLTNRLAVKVQNRRICAFTSCLLTWYNKQYELK